MNSKNRTIRSQTTRLVTVTSALLLALLGLTPAHADPDKNSDMARGDYYFKAGYYLKASESYRAAVLDNRKDQGRVLAFANAVFALGNYHYSSHAIRRAVKLQGKGVFNPQIAAMFPSRLSYIRALEDLKRYVTTNRRDPSALTVLAYTYYADGEYSKCRKITNYLRILDREDGFVKFLVSQIDRRENGESPKLSAAKPKKEVLVEPEPEVKAEPKPTPKAQDARKVLKLPTPKPAREKAATKKAPPENALSD